MNTKSLKCSISWNKFSIVETYESSNGIHLSHYIDQYMHTILTKVYENITIIF